MSKGTWCGLPGTWGKMEAAVKRLLGMTLQGGTVDAVLEISNAWADMKAANFDGLKKEETPRVFYGGPDDELLHYTDPDEYIHGFLGDLFDLSDLPETLDIVKYQQKEVVGPNPEYVLEYVLDSLYDNYGNPDDDYPEATDRMKKAATIFVERVAREYDGWQCEEISRETINLRQWLKDQGKYGAYVIEELKHGAGKEDKKE